MINKSVPGSTTSGIGVKSCLDRGVTSAIASDTHAALDSASTWEPVDSSPQGSVTISVRNRITFGRLRLSSSKGPSRVAASGREHRKDESPNVPLLSTADEPPASESTRVVNGTGWREGHCAPGGALSHRRSISAKPKSGEHAEEAHPLVAAMGLVTIEDAGECRRGIEIAYCVWVDI